MVINLCQGIEGCKMEKRMVNECNSVFQTPLKPKESPLHMQCRGKEKMIMEKASVMMPKEERIKMMLPDFVKV